MPRWVFPEDRTVFVYTNALGPVLEPSTTQGIEVYLDSACTTLAVISDATSRSLIPHSTIRPGTDGLLPYFYGPPDAKVLYARALGNAAVYPMDALDASRLADVDKHQIWESTALPANGERTPPFIWVDTSNSPNNLVYLVVDDTFQDLYYDTYSDFYGQGL